MAALADALAALESPETLYPLAARANALVASDELVGVLSVVHTMLLALAKVSDDALEPRQWDAMRRVCETLGALLRAPDMARLAAVGIAWREFSRPSFLH